ncbi:MAG TPA: UDP-N-acetylglucosamine 2-epimerase [Miltoncostaeaceae bacterium]|nr:UDP-N-acetylglucosamine 2-epimerase [Miltoncostaeaceae bacterium]
MIVVYGTTGELIKLAPLLRRLEERGAPATTVCTGQQPEQIPAMLRDFGLRPPDHWVARGHKGRDLTRPGEIPGWLLAVARGALRARPALRRAQRAAPRPLVLVHGDTFTTVLGALIGRAVGAPVAHLEGGLRSGDWRNPFPEELNRRITSRIATVHLAPGAWAAGNLRRARVRGTIVDTGANTIRDSLAMAAATEPGVPVPAAPFGLVSIHRFELLNDRAGLRAVLELLREASRRVPLLFVDHPVTAETVEEAGLGGLFDDRFRRIPRQRYFPFLALLRRSTFLVTDSGGSQEECAQLGHPCLVHRAVTERRDGLGGPVVLSGLDLDVVRRFLDGPLAPTPPADAAVSPTARILQYLEHAGFVPPGR